MIRRFPLFVAVAAGVSFGAMITAACSSPELKSAPLPLRDLDSGQSSGALPPPSDTTLPEEDPPLPDGAAPQGAVYGHTADTLYLFEPIGKKLTKIGRFSCLEVGNPDTGANGDRMLDIALDRDGVMYGTSDRGFISINPTNASCRYLARDSYPNSLSFVPMGTVDNTKEALVGYVFNPTYATGYVRIDVDNGRITKIGDLNPPNAVDQYMSSGDMIALSRGGNKAYLTVKKIVGDGGAPESDFLAEVDPSTGRIKTILGDIKKADLFGFGYWAGTGYGFSFNGEVLSVDMSNGAAKVLTTLTQDGGPQGQHLSWFGAGVKTLAPTAPTK
jgi:hypothetical protein